MEKAQRYDCYRRGIVKKQKKYCQRGKNRNRGQTHGNTREIANAAKEKWLPMLRNCRCNVRDKSR